MSARETKIAAIALMSVIGGCTASATEGVVDTAGVNGGTGSAGTGSSSGGGVQLVDVDTNQTLQAQPGQGVGVFTEYQTGGHWHVWWTCDTSVTNLSCHFQVNVTVASGAITNVVNQLSDPAGHVAQPSSNAVSATTLTTTSVDGMTFDTSPGVIITLNATIDGNEEGAFLFFVQDGQVNGGYQGALSDPLMLEPSSP
jgi:hypothetical protein